jgi:UDP-glucose 4-epimerase
MPQKPNSPYGETKLAVERLLRQFDAAHGLRSVALRYFNAAGADPDNDIGECHAPETHLIPLAIGAALNGAPALTVHGNDWSTPDGTCIRDYVHVSDLARAHILSLRYLQAGGASTSINLGTGVGMSVREVIAAVERATGATVPHRFGPRRPGDPAALVADASVAAAVLGWVPELTACIIPTAVAWATSRSKPNVGTRG